MTSGATNDLARGDLSGVDLTAIHQLCARYLDLADHDDGDEAAALFVDHGTLQLGSLKLEGRDAIAKFLLARAAQQNATGRVVRHLTGVPYITVKSERQASARSTVAVFAGAGTLPLPSTAPATIFDFVDDIEMSADGSWRFVSRRADVLFTGEGAASFARSTSPS